MRLTAGVRLGPYEIVAPLGAGGMGEVYRARDERLGRDVALKVLSARASLDADMLRRFELEARAAGSINHPGIVCIHDIGYTDSGPYIVSELLEGETLRDRLKRGALGEAGASDLGQQAAEALAAAHERGILHRDLKPENLFITSDGRLKILDFGIARLTYLVPPSATTMATPPVAETRAGMILGTSGYMSPEQVCGLPVDERSDLFSLGAVLYEMLSGSQPFAGESSLQAASSVLHRQPDPLTAVAPALQQAVSGCLEKDPANRMGSARQLATVLKDAGQAIRANAAASSPGSVLLSGRSLAILAAIVLALLVTGLAVYGRFYRIPTAGPSIKSLAILPVTNYSEKAAEAYFADSMTEALIADLARISDVGVTSRTSVMRYKGTTKTTREIAHELGVDGLIEASFIRAGNQVVITATLIDGRSDKRIWSQRYEREMQDVLTMQSQVARAISKEISATLTPRGQKYLDEARAVDPAAHEAYLRGRYELNRYTQQSLYKAIAHFNQAIGIDPGSARAYAGLADSYSALRSSYVPPETVMPKAKECALKAVELDDALAEARVALANVLMSYDWDWNASEQQFKHALGLNPNLASAHQGYALLLAVMGRADDGGVEIDRALRLDPVSPALRGDAAWMFYLERRYDQVVEQAKKAIDLDPDFWVGHTMLGLGYEKLGQYPEALKALNKARSLDDSPAILEMLGGLYATMKRPDDAHAVLAELDAQSKRRYVCPYEVATIHAGLGDRNAALQWLEKGRRDHADCIPWVAVDPKLDFLRGDEGFRDLLRRAGIQPQAPGRER